jgi:hypothetical protein
MFNVYVQRPGLTNEEECEPANVSPRHHPPQSPAGQCTPKDTDPKASRAQPHQVQTPLHILSVAGVPQGWRVPRESGLEDSDEDVPDRSAKRSFALHYSEPGPQELELQEAGSLLQRLFCCPPVACMSRPPCPS